MRRMAKPAGKSNKTESVQKAPTPVVVYFSAAGIGMLSYIVARIALDGRPHPLHWAAMLAGGVVGYFVGWLWYRWRGDII